MIAAKKKASERCSCFVVSPCTFTTFCRQASALDKKNFLLLMSTVFAWHAYCSEHVCMFRLCLVHFAFYIFAFLEGNLQHLKY